MQNLPWSDDFALAVPAFNAEHRQLLDDLNAAMQAARSGSKVRSTMAFGTLRATTEKHFAAEEGTMRETNYPEFARHREAHQELLERMNSFQRRLATEGSKGLDQTSWLFIKRWFAAHIIHDDRLLANYLAAR